MFARLVLAGVGLAVAVGAAAAADPVKVPLKEFKLKAAFDGGDALVGLADGEDKIFFYTNGTATAEVKVPDDGEYTVTVEASCDEAKDVKAKFKLTVGDEVVAKEFELKQTDAKEYPFPAKLKKGTTKLVVEFLNDEFKEGEYDRNFYLHAVKLEPKAKK